MTRLCWTCPSSSPDDLQAMDLLKAVSETIPDLIRVKDTQGRLLFANRAALREIGRCASEVMGRRDLDYLRDQDQARRNMRSDRQVIETGEMEEIEEHFDGPQGTKILLSKKTPLRDAEGKVIGVIVTSSNITARKHAEELEHKSNLELKKAAELKDQFLAIVSHELRTPLTAILAWAHLLLSDKCPDTNRAEICRRLLHDAQTQSQIIDDLLDMTKILAGNLHLAPRPISGAAAIRACVDELRDAAAAKGIKIHCAPHEDVYLIADPRRLHQILANLLSNAVKFTSPGGSIAASVKLQGSLVAISITDNGTGIAAHILPHVFERFLQADSSSTRQFKGLGLGLALVKALTEMHGGSVKAHSAGPGKGASFTVRLPGGRADYQAELEPARPTEGFSDTPAIAG